MLRSTARRNMCARLTPISAVSASLVAYRSGRAHDELLQNGPARARGNSAPRGACSVLAAEQAVASAASRFGSSRSCESAREHRQLAGGGRSSQTAPATLALPCWRVVIAVAEASSKSARMRALALQHARIVVLQNGAAASGEAQRLHARFSLGGRLFERALTASSARLRSPKLRAADFARASPIGGTNTAASERGACTWLRDHGPSSTERACHLGTDLRSQRARVRADSRFLQSAKDSAALAAKLGASRPAPARWCQQNSVSRSRPGELDGPDELIASCIGPQAQAQSQSRSTIAPSHCLIVASGTGLPSMAAGGSKRRQ